MIFVSGQLSVVRGPLSEINEMPAARQKEGRHVFSDQ
jgi:hypothetical protein